MTYQEAINYSFTVKWKTSECSSKDCWCRIIEPATKIEDKDGNEIYIAGSGRVPKKYAEYIVKLHNEHIKQKKKKK